MLSNIRTTLTDFLIVVLLTLFVIVPVGAQDFPTNTVDVTATAFPTEAPVTAIGGGEDVAVQPVPDEVATTDEAQPAPDQNVTDAGVSIIETVVQYLHKFLIENPVFAGVAAFIVGMLKFAPGIKPKEDGTGGISSQALLILVAGVLWLIYTAVSLAGFQTQAINVATRISEFAPYILGFFTTLFTANVFHEQAAKRGIAVIGAKRASPEVGQGSGVLLSIIDKQLVVDDGWQAQADKAA